MKYTSFWLVDVKSCIRVGNENVVFDYINTCLSESQAISLAKELIKTGDVLQLGVHHWLKYEDGSEKHVVGVIDGFDDIPYMYTAPNVDDLDSEDRFR